MSIKVFDYQKTKAYRDKLKVEDPDLYDQIVLRPWRNWYQRNKKKVAKAAKLYRMRKKSEIRD